MKKTTTLKKPTTQTTLKKPTTQTTKIKDKNVILDLDNTIISAEALEDFPFEQSGIDVKAKKFAIHDMDGYYIVFERPYLQDFLDWLFENYNVAVWTAASKDYALFIIDKILLKRPNRKLDFIFFSYHCEISRYFYNYSKKLLLITNTIKIKNYHCDNTIIIDDLSEVHLCQPEKCIPIKPFEILREHSETDEELKHLRARIENTFKCLTNN